MAFEQIGIPANLRPFNIARPVAATTAYEESFNVPVTTNGRNLEGIIPNSGYSNTLGSAGVPVYYNYKVPDAGLVGYPVIGAGNWCLPVPATTGGNQVNGLGCSPGSTGNMISGNVSDRTDQTSEDGGDDSVSVRKVKFMCSIGGKIMLRPSDGQLRYVGGETRIISVKRDIRFDDLVAKMTDTYGQLVAIKYQLPEEDLDALVSVSCPDDLENMMEEYEKLVERSPDGSAKLRVFVFPASELEPLDIAQFEDVRGVSYVDAMDAKLDDTGGNIAGKESIASTDTPSVTGAEAADFTGPFSQGDMAALPGSGMLSPAESITAVSQENTPRLASAKPVPPYYSDGVAIPVDVPLPTVSSAATQPQPVLLEVPAGAYLKQPAVETARPVYEIPQPVPPHLQTYLAPHHESSPLRHMDYPNQQLLQTVVPVMPQPKLTENIVVGNMPQFVPAYHVSATPNSGTNPPHFFVQSSPGGIDNSIGSTFNSKVVQVPTDLHRAHTTYAGQFPPLGFGGSYLQNQLYQNQPTLSGGQLVSSPETMPRRSACYMCQRSLPHAHSDMPVQYVRDGLGGPVSDSNSNISLTDNLRAASVNMPVETNILREVKADQGSGAQMRFVGQTNPQVTSQLASFAMPQSFGTYPYEQIIHMTPETLGNQRMMFPQNVTGMDMQSRYNMVTGNIAQPVQHLPSNQLGIKHDAFGNAFLYNEVPPVAKLPSQAVQQGVFAGPPLAEGSSEIPSIDSSTNNLKLVDEGLEALSIGGKLIERSLYTEVPYRNTPPPIEPHVVAKHPSGGSPALNAQSNSEHHQIISNPGDCQDSSNSLFSNQDPWNMWQEVHFRPRLPTRFPATNELGVKDPADDQCLGNIDGIHAQAQVHSGNSNRDMKEHVPSNVSAGELFRQELGGVGMDVPRDSDLLVNKSNRNNSEAKQDTEAQSKDFGVERSPKFEDGRAHLLDPGNLGYPESDGLGRLQIISNSDLEELQELGSGTFGTVYHGKWKGTDVAIKRISNRCFMGKPSEQDRMRKDFWNEAIKLADLHHPNVVAFYGVVLDGPGGSMATVTEYMVNGSLRTALQKNERSLDKRKRLLILMDVAFGMEYLHGKNIVHFDLKSDNLLVNLRDPHRPVCKVGDLGLSKVKCKTLISGGVRGTLPWMAPELLNGSSSMVSEKVDVYSFGIVMWELLTGEEPYADLHYGTIIGGIVSNTLRPEVPDSCDPEWRSLMERCWSADPSERPNFTEAANQLRAMASKIQK